jgi:hypothetical protein
MILTLPDFNMFLLKFGLEVICIFTLITTSDERKAWGAAVPTLAGGRETLADVESRHS